ncbi:hypothetical protein TNCV_4777741 [Trichonephila clavipes]|nr:hypothetical protein TNCV_4777741 [Trichonephila clavipes]
MDRDVLTHGPTEPKPLASVGSLSCSRLSLNKIRMSTRYRHRKTGFGLYGLHNYVMTVVGLGLPPYTIFTHIGGSRSSRYVHRFVRS